MKKVWIVFVVGLFLILAAPTLLALAEEQGYYITDSAIGLGDGQQSSQNFAVEDTLGAIAVGAITSTNFAVESGPLEFSVLNGPPLANAGGPYLVAVGGTIPLTGSASSDSDGDTLTYGWQQIPALGAFDNPSKVNPMYTAGASGGIVELSLAVDDGILSDSATTMLVVYDPSAGFVTGGGWINSPAGAYKDDATLTGKATFGFVSKYKKGAVVPEGNTEFQFHAGKLNFSSTSYQWLVVAGAKAQYKGVGTINGNSGYGFLLTATDGQITGGGGVDKFRIKIWETSTGIIAYDNGPGTSDDINAASPQTIGGGSIVIRIK